jgi:hypothetical protein
MESNYMVSRDQRASGPVCSGFVGRVLREHTPICNLLVTANGVPLTELNYFVVVL